MISFKLEVDFVKTGQTTDGLSAISSKQYETPMIINCILKQS